MSGSQPSRPEPGGVVFVPVPKPGGARLLSVLSPPDDAEYRAAVARVAPVIESTLAPSVMANRVCHPAALLIEPWQRARRRFLVALAEVVRSGRGLFLRTDVLDCYPSISPSVACECLRRLGCRRRDVDRIEHLLHRFEEHGVRGLPIGPEPSAVLANAVLHEMDAVLSGEGRPWVRWVDDVWAVPANHRHAERVLERIGAALERVGLSLSESKTTVGEATEHVRLGGLGSPSI